MPEEAGTRLLVKNRLPGFATIETMVKVIVTCIELQWIRILMCLHFKYLDFSVYNSTIDLVHKIRV